MQKIKKKKKEKKGSQTSSKSLQRIYLIKDLHAENIKNSQTQQ